MTQSAVGCDGAFGEFGGQQRSRVAKIFQRCSLLWLCVAPLFATLVPTVSKQLLKQLFQPVNLKKKIKYVHYIHIIISERGGVAVVQNAHLQNGRSTAWGELLTYIM